MRRFAARLQPSETVSIVAIGSSSTKGEGNIPPYPGRLEARLRDRYKDKECTINVVNQGVVGEEAPQELARFQSAVLDLKPALVIWQVGTNAVWTPKCDMDDVATAIAAGLKLLSDNELDVIVMDLQYTPGLLVPDKRAAAEHMVDLIERIATAARVNVFRRFDFMRRMVEIEKRSFDALVDPTDEYRLHQSGDSMERVAWELCAAISAAAKVAVG